MRLLLLLIAVLIASQADAAWPKLKVSRWPTLVVKERKEPTPPPLPEVKDDSCPGGNCGTTQPRVRRLFWR